VTLDTITLGQLVAALGGLGVIGALWLRSARWYAQLEAKADKGAVDQALAALRSELQRDVADHADKSHQRLGELERVTLVTQTKMDGVLATLGKLERMVERLLERES
jgi:hypothetical protein